MTLGKGLHSHCLGKPGNGALLVGRIYLGDFLEMAGHLVVTKGGETKWLLL